MPNGPKRKTSTTRPVIRQKPLPEQLNASLRDISAEAIRLAKLAKQRFDQLDDATKRKVVAGLSGLAALLALRSRYRRRKRQRQG